MLLALVLGLISALSSVAVYPIVFMMVDPLGKSPLAGLPWEPEDIKVVGANESAHIADPHNRLKESQVLYKDELAGPESVAFDSNGRGPYLSLSDGRVVRRTKDDEGWETVAVLSPTRDSALCDYPPYPAHAHANGTIEPVCGRPLGLRFHPITGDLYVADAYFGLFRVPRAPKGDSSSGSGKSSSGGGSGESAGVCSSSDDSSEGSRSCSSDGATGAAADVTAGAAAAAAAAHDKHGDEDDDVRFLAPELLVNEVDGKPFFFVNDLDIDAHDENGVIYFTDSSYRHHVKDFMVLLMEGTHYGRLMKYDIKSRTTTLLVANISMANGVALSKDRSFLVFCETTLMRCLRYWLTGPKANTAEVFVNLPGFPDNVRLNPRGRFWIAVPACRSPLLDLAFPSPFARTLLLKLIPDIPTIYNFFIGKSSMIVEVDDNGVVTDVLEDKDGGVVLATSQVTEHDGKLWMGSLLAPQVNVLEYVPPSGGGSHA